MGCLATTPSHAATSLPYFTNIKTPLLRMSFPPPPGPILLKVHTCTIPVVNPTRSAHDSLPPANLPRPQTRLGIPRQSHIPLLSCITAHFTHHICATACMPPWGLRNQTQYLPCTSSKVSRALKGKMKARGCLRSPEKRAVNSNFCRVG